MDKKEFVRIMDLQQKEDTTMFLNKNTEYATEEDVFHHIKLGAKHESRTPEEHLYSLWSKHIVSIKVLLDKLQDPDIPVDRYVSICNLLVREKLRDDRVYNMMLTGLLIDKLNVYSKTMPVKFGKPVLVNNSTPELPLGDNDATPDN